VSAGASALFGLLAAAAIPAAVAVAETADVRDFDLIDAWVAIPVAVVLGLLALVLARRGRRSAARTVARRGDRLARVGRAFGALALALSAAAGIALAFYWYLDRIGA
jgi:hypothetical protein